MWQTAFIVFVSTTYTWLTLLHAAKMYRPSCEMLMVRAPLPTLQFSQFLAVAVFLVVPSIVLATAMKSFSGIRCTTPPPLMLR